MKYLKTYENLKPPKIKIGDYVVSKFNWAELGREDEIRWQNYINKHIGEVIDIRFNDARYTLRVKYYLPEDIASFKDTHVGAMTKIRVPVDKQKKIYDDVISTMQSNYSFISFNSTNVDINTQMGWSWMNYDKESVDYYEKHDYIQMGDVDVTPLDRKIYYAKQIGKGYNL